MEQKSNSFLEIEEKSEHAPYKNNLANAFSSGWSLYGFSAQDYLWQAQRKVILELAGKESFVIVGRCADYILREEADCLKVFIHAEPKIWAKRIVEIYGEGDQAPEKRVADKDKRRKAYYQFYTGLDWGDVRNYHLCLDSGIRGIEKCAGVIAELY